MICTSYYVCQVDLALWIPIWRVRTEKCRSYKEIVVETDSLKNIQLFIKEKFVCESTRVAIYSDKLS